MNRVVTGYDENGDPVVIRKGEPPVVIYDPRTKLLAAIYGEPQRRGGWP